VAYCSRVTIVSSSPWKPLETLQKLAQVDIESHSQPCEQIETWIASPRFERPNVSAMNMGSISQRLLRESESNPSRSYAVSKFSLSRRERPARSCHGPIECECLIRVYRIGVTFGCFNRAFDEALGA
jgi:hypothetical protein